MFRSTRSRPRARSTLPVLVTAMLALSSLIAMPVAAAPAPLTNLAHLDSLGDTVTPPVQAGHTTYRMAEEPSIQVLWVYAEPDGSGGFRHVGGGAYDPVTNTWGQGSYDTDDLARAAVVYIRHWQQFGDAHSRDLAYGLLRTVTYMQTLSNDARNGNFVLWMQPDGTLHASVPGD